MKPLLLYLSAPLVVALLAPIAASHGAFLYPPIILFGTIPVVSFFTLVVAMPIYFALPKQSRLNLPAMLSLSFLAGALSYFLFELAFRGESSQVGSVVLVRNGSFTGAGWKFALLESLAMGALSLPGGWLYWLGARAEAVAKPTAENEA